MTLRLYVKQYNDLICDSYPIRGKNKLTFKPFIEFVKDLSGTEPLL